MGKGFLIAIEGTDGSGKHLQSEMLYNKLIQKGEQAKMLSFPCYDSPSSALVKMYLGGEFGNDPASVNPFAASAFYAVDRVASFLKDWRTDYEDGKILVADRYGESNLVHQGSKLPAANRYPFVNWAMEFEYVKLGIPKPDLVIFLDVPTEVSTRMMRAREQQTNTKADIHERDTVYLVHCREVALDLAKNLGWYVIPCIRNGEMLPPEEINNTIFELCQPKIREFVGRRDHNV